MWLNSDQFKSSMDLGKIASWQKAKPSAAHFSRFSYVENMGVIVIGDRLNFYINRYITLDI